MADVNVSGGEDQGGEFVSEFETAAGASSPSTSASPESPSASPATAGLTPETASTPAAKAVGAAPSPKSDAAPSTGPVDLVAALEKMIAEESGEKPQPQKLSKEAELAKLLDGIQQGTPAHQRIQALANARAEAQATAEQLQAQFQQQTEQVKSYVGQVQQAAQAEIQRRDQTIQTLMAQMQSLTANFEALKNLAPKPPMDPADQIKQQWMDGLKERDEAMRKQWEEKHLAPLQQRLDAIDKERQAERTQKLAGKYYEDALQSAKSITMRGLELPEEAANRAASRLASYVLAETLQTGNSYQEAAQGLRQVVLQLSAAFVRSASKGAAGALKTGKEAPTNTSSRRVDGHGSAMPTLDKLHELGFRDEMEYLAHQEAQG